MENFIGLFAFLGVMIGILLFAYAKHKKSLNNQKNTFSNPYEEGRIYSSYQDTHNKDKESRKQEDIREKRKKHLYSFVQPITLSAKNQIWDINDIRNYIDEFLSDKDVRYLAQQIPTNIFATNVWSIYQKILTRQLSNDQIINIIESGTYETIQRFIDNYNNDTSWTVPSTIVDKILSKNPLLFFEFKQYRKEDLIKIINRLSAYELLGYRTQAKNDDKEIESSLKDLKKSTEFDLVTIDYYESTNNDIIHYLSQYHNDKPDLRTLAFTKILTESSNIVDMIHRVCTFGDFENDEIVKIIDRNLPEEMTALIAVGDKSKFANSFSPEHAIKISLQLVECDYSYEIQSHYDFQSISSDTYKSIINELTADELLGYNEGGGGVYDIIKLFEDNGVEDQELRKIVFEKILSSEYLHKGIERWENVTEEEINVIMERNKDDEVNTLLERDDSEEIITNLPEDIAIKVLLGILYPDALDSVKDNYSFGDKDAFKKIIDELSAKELIGTKDDDIIMLIEEHMNDDDGLRKLAFAKLCEADDISRAIAGWENVTEEEIKVIIERDCVDEINSLLERDDSEEIITNLPDSYIFVNYLLKDEESINDEFDNRIDNNDDFKKKTETAAKNFSLGKLRKKDKETSVENISDELIIKSKLHLVDIDECEFDIDEVKDEYLSRMNNQDFQKKVEKLIELFNLTK